MYNLAQDRYYLINHEATFLRRDGTLAMTADLNMGSQCSRQYQPVQPLRTA